MLNFSEADNVIQSTKPFSDFNFRKIAFLIAPVIFFSAL